MTFEQFIATRNHYADLGDALPAYEHLQPGYVYLDELVIEEVTSAWPAKSRVRGRYFLSLGNIQVISDDLPDLERQLYAYAVSEGFRLPQVNHGPG